MWLRLSLLLLLSLIAWPARGQVAVQQWRPSTEAGGFVALEPPSAPVGYGLGTALWLQYAREPVVLPLGGNGATTVVQDQLTVDATVTVGVFNWLALSLGMPASLYQGGGARSFGINSVGIGDPRLLAKFTLVRPGGRARGLGLAVQPEIGLPLGDRGGLLGERNFTFTPRAAIGYGMGPVWLVANLGYRFREGMPIGELLVDDELLCALGAELALPGMPLAATLELTGATAAARPFFDLKETSIELLASARARIGPISLQPGLAMGVTPGYLVPDYRLFIAVGYAARFRDADGDGVDDFSDRCVEEREDRDGHDDSDGCPDLDDDGDGVPDWWDRCRDVPGSYDNAGCPADSA